MNLALFILVNISNVLSLDSRCNKINSLTVRHICPVCSKFVQFRSTLLDQNKQMRIKVACMTLVKAKCCPGFEMAHNNHMIKVKYVNVRLSLI